MQRAGSLGSLEGASTALANQLPRAAGSASSLEAVPATAVSQACVGPYGQHCGCLIHQLAGRSTIMPHVTVHRHLLLWSHTQLKSLPAVHIPGELNPAADAFSWQLTFPREWRLHPERIRLIWSRFGKAQVDLFASRESSRCQLYLYCGGTGTLAHSWPYVSMHLPQWACSHRQQGQGGRGAGPAGRAIVTDPDMVSRTHFPRNSPSLAHERTSFLRGSAPYGTRVQICGTFMCGSWMGRGRLEWSSTGCERPSLRLGLLQQGKPMHWSGVSVRELVFFLPRWSPNVHDWSSAFFSARKVGA